jgi:FxsC-like protein
MSTPAHSAPIFFVSYARVTPLPSSPPPHTDIDPSVVKFYKDLSRRIAARLKGGPTGKIGFLDADVAPDADWRAERLAALRAAEIFVPLYSPPYFRNSWSIREKEEYLASAEVAPTRAKARKHVVVPVLWTPFAPGERNAETSESVSVGGGGQAYAQNGLRALCRLKAYREEYLDALDHIASKIVEVIESPEIGRVPPRPPIAAQVAYKPATYVVAVLALTKADRATMGRVASYGDSGRMWRPFGPAQAMPIADYAEIVGQRLGLPTRIVDNLGRTGERLRNPGVLLIDPWIMEVEALRHILAEATDRLPPWVKCLVIVGSGDGASRTRGELMAQRVVDMLKQSGVNARHARALMEFDQVMPVLVGESRRAYLKHGLDQPAEPRPGGDLRPGRGRLTPGDQPPSTKRDTNE